MKRIGIITFHTSINYGSFLQAYSLSNYLSKLSGYNVDIIDYSLKSSEKSFVKGIITKKIYDIPKRFRQYNIFKNEIKRQMKLSKKSLITDDLADAIKFINDNYDVVITGSDEIWKIDRIRTFPNIYWLPKELKTKKISYAASANRTDFDCLSEQTIIEMKDILNSYDYIGVRDQNTLNFVKKLSDKLQPYLTPDPTVMYELSKNKVAMEDRILKKYGLNLKNTKIIGIMTPEEEIGRFMKEVYGNRYKIVSIYTYNKHSDYYLYDLNPSEWANIFSYFSLGIIRSFHGAMFSIKNNVPFIAVDNDIIYEKFESKIKHLLKKADLLEWYYYKPKGEPLNNKRMIDMIENAIENKHCEKMKVFIEKEKEQFNLFVESFKSILEKSNVKETEGEGLNNK